MVDNDGINFRKWPGFASGKIMTDWMYDCIWVGMMLLLSSGVVFASCYDPINYGKPFKSDIDRALYIFVDQTTPLTEKMRDQVSRLVTHWGQPGDLAKIVRFSANFRDLQPELIFSKVVEKKPGDAYLFQLRWRDKRVLRECLTAQQESFGQAFRKSLASALSGINSEIPKTDLLNSLKQLAKLVVLADEAKTQNILLISDGMENSSLMSFYKKGKINTINARKLIAKVRRQGLIANWKSANIYMVGLGLATDPKDYITMSTTKSLYQFWERYFVEGNGRIKAIGSPGLLITTID